MKFKSMFNFCKRPFFEYAGKLFTESHSQTAISTEQKQLPEMFCEERYS